MTLFCFLGFLHLFEELQNEIFVLILKPLHRCVWLFKGECFKNNRPTSYFKANIELLMIAMDWQRHACS